jgi:hypothetical protein
LFETKEQRAKQSVLEFLPSSTGMKESKPNGIIPLFGQYGLDLATPWFREMVLKGYKFFELKGYISHKNSRQITLIS